MQKTVKANLGTALLLYTAAIALVVLSWAELEEARALERIADQCVARAVQVESVSN